MMNRTMTKVFLLLLLLLLGCGVDVGDLAASSGGTGAASGGGGPDASICAAEICNGIDDDCDGVPDNGDPGGGIPCSMGDASPCSAGITACELGKIVCKPTTQPSKEVCNGVDDDCDGQ